MSKRSGIMLCYPFEEKRLLKWNPPYVVQPKLDGERCISIYDVQYDKRLHGWTLLSSENNLFSSVPHIIKALKEQEIPWYQEYDGELYTHGLDFSSIHSIVSRTVNLHPDHEQMQYHIFDYVSDDPQWQRIKTLHKLRLKPPLKLVPLIMCNTFDEVIKAYDDILSQGYEGIVVRHIDAPYVRKRSVYMMKFKPKKDDYYRIIGYKEEVDKYGKPKGTLGALSCKGDDGTTFFVGSGLTRENRETLWTERENLIGKLCHVQYQHITSGKGVPRFPVFVEITEAPPENNLLVDFEL